MSFLEGGRIYKLKEVL